MSDLETFRKETRAWLEANCPAEMRRPMQSEEETCWGGRHAVFDSDAQRLWLERMGEKGWTVPEWPREYGGGGLSREQAKILSQEMRAINARSPLSSFGIWMLGPALLKYGSEEQKRESICRKSHAARFDGARDIRNPARAPTSRRYRLAPRTRAISSSSTDRKSGLRTPTRPTGFSAWSAPIRTRPNTTASALSSSTWRAPAFRPSRSRSSPARRPSARLFSTTCSCRRRNPRRQAEQRMGHRESICSLMSAT